MPPIRAAVLCVVVIFALTGSTSFGHERHRRDWSDHPGMPRQIYDIANDDRGFLWTASEQGIQRFDGRESVPWGPDVVRTAVHALNPGPAGQIVGFTTRGRAYEVTTAGLEVVLGPDGEPFDDLWDADYAGDGALWLCDDVGLFRRSAQGGWARIEAPLLEGQSVYQVRGAPNGSAYVGTLEGRFLRVTADRRVEVLLDDPTGQITRIAVMDDGLQAFGLRFGPNHGIYLVEDGGVRQVWNDAERERRWTGLAFRGGTLWAVSTGYVLAIREAGTRVEVLQPEDGFHLGGTVVVDHENSLWLTSFRGLYQFPDPEVVMWTDMDGTREVHEVGPDMWIGRWAGPHRLDRDDRWIAQSPGEYRIFDWGGVAPWGSIWFVGVDGQQTPRQKSVLLEHRSGKWVRHLTRDLDVHTGAYAIDAGVFWVTYHDTLWRVRAEGAAPEPVSRLPVGAEIVTAVAVRGDRVIVAFRYGPYCEGTLNTNRSALESEWSCESIDGAGELTHMLLLEDGTVWVGTEGRGVVRRSADDWETIVGETELGTTMIRGISISPRGGIWVVSSIGRIRVEPQRDSVRVVERLGSWIGVPDWMTFRLLEQSDGTIWLSGMTSTIRVPVSSRQRPTRPPKIYVTGFRADGVDLLPGEPQRLPATTRRIEVHWAAPAFRDPASLRYHVRADATGEWVTTRERSFRFVDLGPGDYRVEVRASLDGHTWSETAAGVRFSIRSPLWRRPRTWAALLAGAVIAILSIQWLRTRQQVRLERHRTAIAMNLHDELGAGLGSIGLLTDLVSGAEMDRSEQRDVATRVGEISRDLSRSLSDIVWTLRPASADLPGFVQFLRQRASDLLSGVETTVEFEFPDEVPATPLRLEVRRQIHAIASEVLHNIAKHAKAGRVKVSLRADGALWTLRVADDGVGFDGSVPDNGLGLESMRRRAAIIGARLTMTSEPGSGSCFELSFSPQAGGGR